MKNEVEMPRRMCNNKPPGRISYSPPKSCHAKDNSRTASTMVRLILAVAHLATPPPKRSRQAPPPRPRRPGPTVVCSRASRCFCVRRHACSREWYCSDRFCHVPRRAARQGRGGGGCYTAVLVTSDRKRIIDSFQKPFGNFLGQLGVAQRSIHPTQPFQSFKPPKKTRIMHLGHLQTQKNSMIWQDGITE